MTSTPRPPSDASPARRPQDVGVLSLRGLAIVLMVMGHVVGAPRADGSVLADLPFWRGAEIVLGDVRMPLFTVLSGYVYAMRPLAGRAAVPRFLRGKLRRLYVPVLVVGTAFFLVQSRVDGTNETSPLTDIWRVWTVGYGHFWFALALLGIFVVLVGLELSGALRTLPRWGLTMVVTGLLWVLVHPPAEWEASALSGFLRLLPYFLLGLGLRRFPQVGAGRGPAAALALLGLGGLVLAATTVPQLADMSAPIDRAVTLVCVLPALVGLVRAHDLMAWRPLAWLGQFSYGIYLLHVFGTAGARIVLDRAAVDSGVLVFLLSLLAGLALPVLVELVLAPSRVAMLAVFGQRSKERSTYQRVLRS